MFTDFYGVFYNASLVFSLLIGLIFLKKTNKPFNWIVFLMAITLISEMIAKYIAYGLHASNNVVYHFFTPIEYAIYVIIFLKFPGLNQFHKPLWLSVVGLFILEIINTIYFQSLGETNTNVMIAESVLLVILSLLLFLKLRETPIHQDILKEGVFWFNSAVLCYYAFNILIWGFHNMKVYLLENPPQIIYDFNKVISGILYLIFSAAIYINATQANQLQTTHD